MSIFKEQLQFVRSPKMTIAQMEGNSRAAFVGFKHILFLALLYEIVILLWALGGATPTLPAFLKIPDDQYYYYQLIFGIPLFLIVWLLAGGIAYVLSKALGGNGSYDTILGGFGIAAIVSAYFAIIPDLIQGVLWTTGWVPFAEYQQATSRGLLLVIVWGYMLAYVVCYLVLYSATIHYSQNLGKLKSTTVAIIAFFASNSIFMTIYR
ncbi:MAG: hypothetical protein OER97_01535 [Gammaproteobacteria bacterium]|nr:hypothetical protein [Gammaproteobacteria bacterium]